MSDIKPIETEYNGYRFRSRLEARWAVFFDTLGIKYYYEHEGFDLGDAGWYLPDFWLPELKTWIEIKGNPEEYKQALKKAEALANQTNYPVGVFEGLPGEFLGAIYIWNVSGSSAGGPNKFDGEFAIVDTKDGVPGIWLLASRYREYYTGWWERLPLHRSADRRDYFTFPSTAAHAISAAKSARFEHGENGGRRR